MRMRCHSLNSTLPRQSSRHWRRQIVRGAGSGFGAPRAALPSRSSREASRIPLIATHILLAEDNPINQKVARRLLERLGYVVEVAVNGREAVQKWAAGGFDLILMDCQMPEMDGYEATRRIRSTEAGRSHIPIVAVTANAMVGDREKCLGCGMDAFVPKPIKTEVLTETIEHFLAAAAGNSSTIS